MAQKRFEALGNRDATVIEAEGLAKARELQGYTWQQEQQFDVTEHLHRMKALQRIRRI